MEYVKLSHVKYAIWNMLVCPRADGEGTNSPRLFTPGKTKALALKFINYRGRGSPTVLGGWSSSLISKLWRTVMKANTDWSILKFVVVWQMTTSKWRLHQISRAWVANGVGWVGTHPHWSQNYGGLWWKRTLFGQI